jgi:microcystin-dependent protein
MGTPFMSELRIMSFNFAPVGWAECNGQFLPINQNQALFSLLGTMYGGNGQTTFALPDLRGKVPIHVGQGFSLGQASGQESHTLTQSEMPAHTHLAQATSSTAATNLPTGNLLASINAPQYNPPSGLTTLAPSTVTNVGGSQPHPNQQPFLVLNICIALSGAFPSQN